MKHIKDYLKQTKQELKEYFAEQKQLRKGKNNFDPSTKREMFLFDMIAYKLKIEYHLKKIIELQEEIKQIKPRTMEIENEK